MAIVRNYSDPFDYAGRSARSAQGDTKENPFNNPTARSKATPLEKRPQFAVNLRLLGKGVNVRDFYNT